MKKILVILVTTFCTVTYAQTDSLYHPLLKATYEVSFLSNIARNFPATGEHKLGDLVKNMSNEELKSKIQKTTTLFNLVCGQTYVIHLKELTTLNAGNITKKDLSIHNYYNQYDLTASSNPMSEAWAQGLSQSNKLIAKGNFSEISEVCQSYLTDLDRYLQKELEQSYRDLFDLKTDSQPQHPYHAHFFGKDKEFINSKGEL